MEALNSVDLSNIKLEARDQDVAPPLTSYPKNLILYGPPGTGKTYHTMIYAVAIIEGSEIDDVRAEAADDFDAVSARFRDYLKDGRVAFTTFHQSFSYEEFIEGIRPVVDDADGASGEVRYRIVDGIFKDFCAYAQSAALSDRTDSDGNSYGMNRSPTVWKVSLQGTGDNPTRRECMENGHIRIGWSEYGPDITSETEFTEGGKDILERFIYTMRVGDIVLSCWSASEIDAIGVITGEYEWHDEYSGYKRVRPVRWLVKGIRENIIDMNSGAQMTRSTVYKLKISVDDVMGIIKRYSDNDVEITTRRTHQPCVFIIDEINRGNISKIFGELITLIEESKRTGCREALTSTLPYSRESFGVPDNVYIIGTMNTADRSIARLDTALRRRFTFREMMPEPELLDDTIVDGVNVGTMLRAMNERISALHGRDRQIGHSYFLQLCNKDNAAAENLADLFDDKILPLLEEYFYDDRDKIKSILGSAWKDFYKSIDMQGETVLERVAAPNFGDAYIKIYS